MRDAGALGESPGRLPALGSGLLATHSAVLLLNVEILLVLAGGGFGVYLLVWELTRGRAAAVVVGTAYTGLGFRISNVNLGHVHALALHIAPLVLILLLRLRRERSWPTTVLLTVLVGLQCGGVR